MTGVPEVGSVVDDFTLPGGELTDSSFERRDFRLGEQRGKPVVLVFYPGDDTPVCTRQLCSYTSGLESFAAVGAQVWAVSPQSVDSHEAFARRHGLRMPLLADGQRLVSRSFGITAPGIGLRRAVFLIAPDGRLHWKHVSLFGATFQSVATLSRELAAFA